MKFKIKEIRVGNQQPFYKLYVRKWYGWSAIKEYSYNYACSYAYDIVFQYVKDAEEYVAKYYPTTEQTVKYINI